MQEIQSPTPYFVERITRFAELNLLVPEWDEIDALSSPRTPFSSPLWNLLWWRHFRENRLWVRDELFILTVRREGSRLVAVAPLMRTVRPGWGPLRIREIHFFGADPNVTEWRGVVCRPECRAEAIRALHAYLLEQADEWDSIHWCGIPADEPVKAFGVAAPSRTVNDYYLRLPGSWLELMTGLSRNMKEALRKCYNSLKRSGHSFTFRAITDPREVDAALNDFLRLHRARAELPDTVVHRNIFDTVRSRRFLRDYAHRMAERDKLCIFQLIVGDSVIATRIGFVLGKEIYLYYSGYSPEWRRFSVMTTLTAECIKWALERKFEIVNLSTGSDYAKARWRPAETASNDYLVRSPSVECRFIRDRLFGLLHQEPARSMLRNVVTIARRGR